MQRTQIYLPKTQHQTLQRLAQQKQTSLAGIVRYIIQEHVMDVPTAKQRHKPILSFIDLAKQLARQGKKAPKDLATHLDRYLYGRI